MSSIELLVEGLNSAWSKYEYETHRGSSDTVAFYMEFRHRISSIIETLEQIKKEREGKVLIREDLLDKFFRYFHEVSIPHLKRMTKFWDKHYKKFLNER